MQIENIFEKSINRQINGVIKVEQRDTEIVFDELSEYVLTQEVEEHYNKLIRAYNRCLDGSTDKIGVWISGFFGSGKSHFLKMLSYLLANIAVDDFRALQFFKEKIDDPMFMGDIERAVTTGNTDAILFNIDSKSDTNMHGSQDAIVQVFMKAFNEYIGYCAEIPWLAELERQLEDKGQYDDFKKQYEKLSGSTWEDGRDAISFERDNIIEVLSETTSMSKESAEKWFDSADTNYAISVEKFAKIVNAYCDKKTKENTKQHRVIFLVDEVGQYIGDNRELMLNLQTIVEDLGSHLKGKAWVMVTSQEAIDSITKIKGEDFSKIRGRFATNISLSSDNTDEVIKKRLLLKNETGQQHLGAYWADINSTLKNLFTFSAGTAEMKSYRDKDNFIDVYPFVPYQFNLLQKVFEQVRKIGASGAHLSEGERSMLSAFQESARKISDLETGELVPFHYFYASIEAFLHGGIKRTVNQAKLNEHLDERDCDLLKTLFMIKYIKEVRPNIENLTTLSLTSVNEDKHVLRKTIQESLERLVKETLVHQNGDEFEFLTNEEQDITRKIKALVIEEETIIHHVGDVVFAEIYADTRLKMGPDNVYGVNKKVDSVNKGMQSNELTLKIVTPWDDDASGSGQLQFATMSNAVIVKLPDDASYLEDIREMKQIERYNTRESTLTNSETIRNIISDKARLATKIRARVFEAIKDAVSDAEFYVKGLRADINRGEPRGMITQALTKLAENVYPKRNYVKEHCRFQDDVKKILKRDDLTLFSEQENGLNKEAWREIMDFVQQQTNRMLPVTVKTINERFTKNPYGWSELDIAGLLTSLYVQGRIKFKENEEFIKKNQEIPGLLTNKRKIEKIKIEPREEIDESLLIRAKKTINEAFGVSNLPDGVETLLNKCKEILEDEMKCLQGYQARYRVQSSYPGKDIVDNGIDLIKKLIAEDNEIKFFEKLNSAMDDLIDLKEDSRDLTSFFENQADIFDQAIRHGRIFSNDLDYFDDKIRDLFDKLNNIISMKEPYTKIKDLPDLTREIKSFLNTRLGELRKDVITKIKNLENKVFTEIKDLNLKNGVQGKIENIFKTLMDGSASIEECHKMAAYQMKIDNAQNAIYDLVDSSQLAEGSKQPVSVDSDELLVTSKEKIVKSAESHSQCTLDDNKNNSQKVNKLRTGHSSLNTIKKTVKVKLSDYSGAKITNKESMADLLNKIKKQIESHLDEGNDVRVI